MQLEFDFTFWIFCDLVDKETGEVVGGAVEECFLDSMSGFFYPTLDVLEAYEIAPFFLVCHKKCA